MDPIVVNDSWSPNRASRKVSMRSVGGRVASQKDASANPDEASHGMRSIAPELTLTTYMSSEQAARRPHATGSHELGKARKLSSVLLLPVRRTGARRPVDRARRRWRDDGYRVRGDGRAMLRDDAGDVKDDDDAEEDDVKDDVEDNE